MVNYKYIYIYIYNFQKSIKSLTVFTSSKFEVTFKLAHQLQNLQFTSSVSGMILTEVNGMDILLLV